MSIKKELLTVLDILNESIDDLALLMREKLASNEIDEYRRLKVIYDKLKGTV